MIRRALPLILIAALSGSAAMAQIDCSSGSPDSTKLVCQFPFATGVLSNASALGQTGQTGVQKGEISALGVAEGLNVAVATQLAQLPLATASAGTVVAYKNGVPETFSNLGPIITQRAQTIGRHKVYLGVTASQYVFTNVDGLQLGNLPFGYSRQAYNSAGTLVSTTYTKESTSGTLVVDQLVAVATIGISRKIDISVIVPFERVSVGSYVPSSTEYIVSANGAPTITSPGPSPSATGIARHIGDGEAGLKYEFYNTDRSAVSGGFLVRAPTGDDLNLLGSGAWGFNPYLVYSHLGRISPHFRIAYQWNTPSELNNPTYTNPIYNSSGNLEQQSNKPLPGGMQYDAGAELEASRRLTLVADLLGYQFVNVPGLVETYDVVPGSSPQIQIPTLAPQNTGYWTNNVATGFKWNPAGHLVLSGNVLTQINSNSGLRARPTPLVGISYKF